MFIVLTRTEVEPPARERMRALARLSRPIIERQPGLIRCDQHEAHDGSEHMTLWAWESEAAHLTCMQSADWADFNTEWDALTKRGDIRFWMKTYQRTARVTPEGSTGLGG